MAEIEEKFPAQWALDLLEPTRLDRSNHIFKYYLVPFSAASLTVGAILKNLIEKKPLTANKPYIALACLVGIISGYAFHWASDVRYARRDALLRDYIMLHPERFPEPDVKKYADIFDSWLPNR